MKYFDDLDSYREYVEALPSAALRDILHSIDRERYPERLRIVQEILKERGSVKAKEPRTKRPFGITFLRVVYPILTGLIFLGLVLGILFPQLSDQPIEPVGKILTVTVLAFISVGLRRRSTWVVLLVLAFCAWSLFGIFINVLSLGAVPPDEQGVARIGLLLGTCFYAFQVIVFLRRETQDYFEFRGFPLL